MYKYGDIKILKKVIKEYKSINRNWLKICIKNTQSIKNVESKDLLDITKPRSIKSFEGHKEEWNEMKEY